MHELSSIEYTDRDTELVIRFTSDDDLIEFGNPDVSEWFLEKTMQNLQESTKTIVFNFDGLGRINSALLGMVVQMQKETEDRSIEVGVRGANQAIKKVMELTRLTHLLLD